MEKFDVVVIGGGPGGYPAAIRAAQLGASVALVEKELLGGTCLNWGCIPSKALIAASCLHARMRQASVMGIEASGVGFNYARMTERRNEVVRGLRSGVGQLLKSHRVTVYQGRASFLARNRIAVEPAAAGPEKTSLEAANTIIASGSVSAMPGFLPKGPRIIESRGFLEAVELPGSLLVLGGGVIGCEFACLAAQLGVQVTVVELLEDILMMLDADVRREVRRHMEKELGIRILTGRPLEQIETDGQKVQGRAGEEVVQGEILLVAVGRKPVTGDLELGKAGVQTTPSGHIRVDAYCRTSAATVYAVGDVNGGVQLAHAATSQGLTVAENICGKRRTRAETLVPSCIFTSPEIGSVGLTEEEAKQRGVAFKAGKFHFAALGKARAIDEAAGFVKWIADAATDQLLGAHAVGPHATELISEATVAIRSELTAAELGRAIHCHPTLAEAWMEAAHALHGTCIHAPPARKPSSSPAAG